VIGTNCIGSCKSNYRTITATTIPQYKWDNTGYFNKKSYKIPKG